MIIDLIYIKNPYRQKYFLFETMARVFSRCIITVLGFDIDKMLHRKAKELLKTYVYLILFTFKIYMQDYYLLQGNMQKNSTEGNPELRNRGVVTPLYAFHEACVNPPGWALQPCDSVRAWEQRPVLSPCPGCSFLPHRNPVPGITIKEASIFCLNLHMA